MSTPLNPAQLFSLLEPGGPISLQFSGYEVRAEQRKMLAQVAAAFNSNQIALIEAGTGIGKSLAYLLPALIWAVTNRQKVVISTHTIALQEQILQIELPRLIKALNLEVKPVVAKGMGRYLCLYRLEEALNSPSLFDEQTNREIEEVELWSRGGGDGELEHSPAAHSPKLRHKLRVEGSSCRGRKCPLYGPCHYFRARKRAGEALVVVVNHALLISELANPSESSDRALSGASRLIVDEAHHLESTALRGFSQRLSNAHLSSLFRQFRGKTGISSRLQTLAAEIKSPQQSDLQGVLNQQIAIQLPLLLASSSGAVVDLFEGIRAFFEAHREGERGKIRLALGRQTPLMNEWQQKVAPLLLRAGSEMRALAEEIGSIEKLLKEAKADRLDQLMLLRTRADASGVLMERFASTDADPQCAHWIEGDEQNFPLCVAAPLDVDSLLADRLFNHFSTAILCSATLTANRGFDYLRERLGITDQLLESAPNEQPKIVTQGIHPTPFDLKRRARLCIPHDFPPPTHPDYPVWAMRAVVRAIEASGGNALILTTSYRALNELYQYASQQLGESFPLLRQGMEARSKLLDKLRRDDRSVLFATYSFWEGVDVPGEALRLVVIAKLPFFPPNEPLHEAQCEKMIAEGVSPFVALSLPAALIRFKQGFGRLLRRERDRGCVLCLDSRVITRFYGHHFLEIVPKESLRVMSAIEIFEEMRRFYHETRPRG